MCDLIARRLRQSSPEIGLRHSEKCLKNSLAFPGGFHRHPSFNLHRGGSHMNNNSIPNYQKQDNDGTSRIPTLRLSCLSSRK